MTQRDEVFTAYVAARSGALLRTAYVLTADRHEAEDLLQTALARLYVAWPRVAAGGSMDAYVCTTMARALISWRRNLTRRREVVTDPIPETARVGDNGDADDSDRELLLHLLRGLPPRQRAVIVVRYYEDLSVAQTASALGMSTGSVKSQASRGLRRLRGALEEVGETIDSKPDGDAVTRTVDEQRVAEFLELVAGTIGPVDVRESALRAGRRRLRARRAMTLVAPVAASLLVVLVVSAAGLDPRPDEKSAAVLPATAAPTELDCTGFPFQGSGAFDYAADGPADTTPPLQQAERWAAAMGLHFRIPGLVPAVAEAPGDGQVVFYTDANGRARAILTFRRYLDGWRLEGETTCSSGIDSGSGSSPPPQQSGPFASK